MDRIVPFNFDREVRFDPAGDFEAFLKEASRQVGRLPDGR
jgi:hypothetical protein